ncbi:MAG: hypothetical protein ACOC16_00620 [Nanoarchaeota archaeon]
MASELGFTIALPLVVGLIVGMIEAFFVYEDENMTSGRDFLKDMWHGLLFAVIGVIVASNVPWIMNHFIPENFHGFLLVDGNGNSIVVSSFIAIFMFLKMVASHKIRGVASRGFSEKPIHKLIVALLIGFAPYYILLIAPMLTPITDNLPDWIV